MFVNPTVSDPFRRNDRGCHCSPKADGPSRGPESLPDGYCGWCEVCGRPGHNRFFPGVLPFRGSWCDRHYRRLRRLHPLGAVGVLYWTVSAWFCVLVLLMYGLR